MAGSVADGIHDDQSSAKELRAMFARFGIPEMLVSDNGTALTSEEFTEFARSNQIRHITVAPYHPSSNGEIERMVQETKQVLHFHMDGSSLQRYFLEGSRSVRHFYPGDAVYARNYRGGTKWVTGFISSVTGPLSYQVRLDDGSLWRHVDQIRSRASPLGFGGADSDSGGDTADDVDPSVVGQDLPLPGRLIRGLSSGHQSSAVGSLLREVMLDSLTERFHVDAIGEIDGLEVAWRRRRS
ncbi:hypothetical protein MTO96_051039 [Rhipicephalus appendiculatus]